MTESDSDDHNQNVQDVLTAAVGQDGPGTASDPPASRWSRMRVRLSQFLCVVALSGLVLRLTMRDALPFLATVFYATPLPVIAIGLLFAAILHPSPKTRFRRLQLGGAFLCFVVFCWGHIHRPGDQLPRRVVTPIDQSLRVAVWNTARGAGGWPEVFQEIKSWQADVIGVVEFDLSESSAQDTFRKQFPTYHVHMLRHEMLLLTKLSVVRTDSVSVEGTNFAILRLAGDSGPIRVIIADFKSSPLRSRRTAFERLKAVINEDRSAPLILMGDFNTPTESVFFDDFRESLSNIGGACGYDCTWPVPCPVMAIDLMWVTSHFEVLRRNIGWTWVSDHRPVMADIKLRR